MSYPVLDPTGAANRLLGMVTNVPAMCLHYASVAILDDEPVLVNATTAAEWWGDSPTHYTGYPPVDYPGFFTTRDGRGDVCLYVGTGSWVCVDGDGIGKIGIQTTAERERQVGGTYRGFSRYMSGYSLVSAQPIKPPVEGELMNPFGISVSTSKGQPYRWALVSSDLAHLVKFEHLTTANAFAKKYGTFTAVTSDEWNNFLETAGQQPDVIP